MNLKDWLRRRTILIVIITLAVISAGLYARLRYVKGELVKQATESIRLAAALDSAVAEARRVRAIETDTGRGVVAAGATVTGKVEARVERTSEASGDATVEVFGDSQERVVSVVPKESPERSSGRLTLTDDHARFEASADYSYSTDAGLRQGAAESGRGVLETVPRLTLGKVSWRIHQIFQIETVEFSQQVEGATLWRGYAVTLTERSPVTGEELERWVVDHKAIAAEYVPSEKRRSWAMFTAAGFTYFTHGYQNNADFGFYGEAGLRVKNISGAVGLTDYSPYARLGWGREW